MDDGAFVQIPDGAVLEAPLQILFVSTGGSSTMSHPRLLLIAGDRSQSRVVETYVGAADLGYFTNEFLQSLDTPAPDNRDRGQHWLVNCVFHSGAAGT